MSLSQILLVEAATEVFLVLNFQGNMNILKGNKWVPFMRMLFILWQLLVDLLHQHLAVVPYYSTCNIQAILLARKLDISSLCFFHSKK